MRHSWLKLPGLLGALIVVLALVAPAQASGDVDWTAYIDTSQPTRASSTAPAKTSRAKVTKRGGKKVAKAKTKVKARAKKKKARR
jgi:hypothetical protein